MSQMPKRKRRTAITKTLVRLFKDNYNKSISLKSRAINLDFNYIKVKIIAKKYLIIEIIFTNFKNTKEIRL